jgi:GT2 family glycosyltransferase
VSLVPELSIVIVNYNTGEFTAQCIDSIYNHPPRYSFEIILIDNASTDGSADWLEKHYPQIILIRNPRNTGIAGGNNLGIKASTGKFVLLLNNDTLTMPGSIDRAVDFLEKHPEAGGVGGNLLNPDKSFQSGYIDFPTLAQVFLITTRLGYINKPFYPSHPRGREILEVDWMSSAFMLFRREALFDVGLVNEEFFIYSDESDLQYRMKNAGWKIYYLPDLDTIHFGGKSLNPWRRRRLVYRGYLLFFTKHHSRLEQALLRVLFLTASTIKLTYWWIYSLFDNRNKLATHEMDSNRSIIKMCLKQGIEGV